MIEKMWLKTTVQFNGFPREVEPSAIDVAVKLNELIDAYNEHYHDVDHDCMGTTSETSLPSDPIHQPNNVNEETK